MYKVIESQNRYGNCYDVQLLVAGDRIDSERTVQYQQYITRQDGRDVILIYTSEMEPVEEAIRFLNYGGMHGQSQNHILVAASALRTLYAYLDIYGIQLKDMTQKEAVGYLDFLKGIPRAGLIYESHLVTHRKGETINSYLHAIRRFVEYLGYENHVFLQKKTSLVRTSFGEEDGNFTQGQTYKLQAKSHEKVEVPAYIRLDEFKKILAECEKTEDPLCNRLICRLMFEHGLRLGECLGLTIEDITSFADADGLPLYAVELRNRLSDTPTQSSKSTMRVHTPDDYLCPEYKRKNIGYWPIIIGEDLAMELLEYINTVHLEDVRQTAKEKEFFKRRKRYAKADSVPGGNKNIKENYYVFLNSIGRPLSENLFNKRLRKIFTACGIPVDKGTRQNNCSHRFRHGYAMFLTNTLHLSDFDVKTLMRHKHISTTAVYHKPTVEDVAGMQKTVLKGIRSIIFGEKDGGE